MAKFCGNCGSSYDDNMMNCPNCGAPAPNNGMNNQQFNNQPNPGYAQPNNGMNYQGNGGVMPVIPNRSIVTAILLTIVTCGIYGLYWLICMTNESNSLSEQNKTADGGMTILFILITCGIYQYYWMYKMGKKLHEAGIRYGRPIQDNSLLYLILTIFGLGIVSEIMIQNDLNKFAQ